jgi:hypothetical protein
MTVHLFVATSSPSCCNSALQHIAKENIDEFDTAVFDKPLNLAEAAKTVDGVSKPAYPY